MLDVQQHIGDSPEESPDEVPLESMYSVLSRSHRRAIVESLTGQDTPLALADAAEEVVRRVHEKPSTEIPDAEIEEESILLYHLHIPKLAETGTVDWDKDRNTVCLTEEGERLASVIERSTTGFE